MNLSGFCGEVSDRFLKSMKTRQIMSIFGIAVLLSCCSTNNTHTLSDHQEDSHSELSESINLYSTYDLSKENPGCELTGFCVNEPFGRWTDGDTATIGLMTAPMAEVTVKLNVDRVITPDNEPFELDIEVNGERLSHISTNSGNSIYVNIQNKYIGADGFVRLMFIFRNAAYPSKYNPGNGDGRKLGFAISGLTVYGYTLKN